MARGLAVKVAGGLFVGGFLIFLIWEGRQKESVRKQEESVRQLHLAEEAAKQEMPDRELAFKTADLLNSDRDRAFGTQKEMHPASLIHLSARELKEMGAGIEGKIWDDPYWRFSLWEKPREDKMVRVWTKPRVFVVRSKFFAVDLALDCGKSTRTIHRGRSWSFGDPQNFHLLVRINKEGAVLASEEDLAQHLDLPLEHVVALGVWPKTCKWTLGSGS